MKPDACKPAVRAFERAFANRVGQGHALAFWKGRVAMYAILRALGVGEGDEVILPGYTCVMDVNPIKYLKAKPVYADIDPNTYNVLPEEVEQKVSPRTKVIIAQHTYGFPCEMDAIMDTARRHGIPVVEDCCLAMGSRYGGKLCGTFGLAAYWSFQWNKPFTTGVGGMATTNDSVLAEKIASICDRELICPSAKSAFVLAAQRLVYRLAIYPRTTALATNLFRWLTRKGLVIGSSSTAEFRPIIPQDFFMGMSPGQARAGLRQLKMLDRNLAHRKRIKELYDRILSESGCNLPAIPECMEPILVRYPIRVADKPRAVAEAPSRYLEVGTWFECPLHPIETPLELYDYEEGMCPAAERASREVINLPLHPRVTDGTAKRSMDFVLELGLATQDKSKS